MKTKQEKLTGVLELKFNLAEAEVAKYQAQLLSIKTKINKIEERRKMVPEDPGEQLVYERHLSWLDRRTRELSIEAAQVMVQLSTAKTKLRRQFGQRTAFEKVLKREAAKALRSRD